MTLNDWSKECHQIAYNHGWWDKFRGIPEVLCLIHSEVSEALEAYRKEDMENFNEELADIMIRVFDLAGYLNIDMDTEVASKVETNKNRPYRHGNKKA